MYNYYIYEKQQKEKEEKQNNKEKENKEKKSHRILTHKLAANYDNRIKKFIVDLARKPIIIKDYYSPLDTSRQNQKGFVFRKYLTERERIDRYLNQKKTDLQIQEKLQFKKSKVPFTQREKSASSLNIFSNSSINNNNNNDLTKQSDYIYQQPIMRFKHRTDLERVVDSLNQYNFNMDNLKLVDKQMNNLGLSKIKIESSKNDTKNNMESSKYNCNNNDNLDNNHKDSDNESSSSEENNNNNNDPYYNNNKKNSLKTSNGNSKSSSNINSRTNNNKVNFGRPLSQKCINNPHFKKMIAASSSMRELMGDYNIKTHFKGAKQLADKMTYDIQRQKKIIKTRSVTNELLDNLKNNNFNSLFKKLNNKSNFSKTQRYNNRFNDYKNINVYMKALAQKQKEKLDKDLVYQIQNSLLHEFPSKFPICLENFDIISNLPLLYNLDSKISNLSKDDEDEEMANNYEGYKLSDDYYQKMDYLKKIMGKNSNEKKSYYYMILDKIKKSTNKNVKNVNIQDIDLEGINDDLNQGNNISKANDIILKNLSKQNNNKLQKGYIDNREEILKRLGIYIKKVNIDNESIPISQVNVIANKVLKKCNFVHSKSKNNSTSLRKGDGKLMFTNGMTVRDFEYKYNV